MNLSILYATPEFLKKLENKTPSIEMHEPFNSGMSEEYLRTTKAYPKSTTIRLFEH